MAQLIPAEDFDGFRLMKDVPAANVTPELRQRMRELDEREDLEPLLRLILADDNPTPHGPAEIVDVFTHRLSARGEPGMAAMILKGRSFKTVRPGDVGHQIYRLEKIDGLRYAIFGAAGTVLDGVKEQFCSTCERLGVGYGFLDATDLARLFVAAGFFCPRDALRITAGRCKCGYSPQHRFLNILQRDALRSLADSHAIGHRAGLVVLPPGSGKTRIAAEDAKRLGAKRVLYVGHTHEILDVAASEFAAVFGAAEVGDLEGTTRATLATVQLLARRAPKIPADAFDYVVVDEFHHAAAASYRRITERFQPKFMLGLTATPFRGDRQDIFKLCGENTVVNYELRGAIEAGVLVPYHYYGCFDDVDYTKLQANGTTYSVRDLERALIIPERDYAIIRKWRELAEARPTLAFCCSVKHAERVAQSFAEAGVAAGAYTSECSREERTRLLREFSHGRLRVLVVVDVMNEGADLPFVECLLFLRPTDSKRIFLQQLGRGLRRSVGKAQCVVVDFIGNFRNAYRIVEFQGLAPMDGEEPTGAAAAGARRLKDVLNLPAGCEVTFDDRVIDLFASQTFNPAYATRQNVGRILIYQYAKQWRQMGRPVTQREWDRSSRLSSELCRLVFGSWANFARVAAEAGGPPGSERAG